MARLEFEDFAEKELTRIYVAARVSEAARVERTLTEHGVDYAVGIESFATRGLGLFPSEHSGAAFYALSGQAAFARSMLAAAGLKSGLQPDEG